MSRIGGAGKTLLVCIGLTLFVASGTALADAPNNAELFALIQKLQSRVTTLEAQAETYRKEAEAAQAGLQKMAALSEGSDSGVQPLRLAAPQNHSISKSNLGVPATDEFPVPQWSGIFWGASFGGGLTQSKVDSRETRIDHQPTQTYTESSLAKSSGHDGGVALDVFAGLNKQIGSHFVGGIQVEGSLADLSFDSGGTESEVDSTGFKGTESFRPHVHSRWMVSALARAGWLVSPTTLTYGLTGWTGAEFDYQNVSFFSNQPEEGFWANGITVGGGVEQKLDANWSIRAEYRYTDFLNANVSGNTLFSGNSPNNSQDTIKTKFDDQMQTVRVGVSYLLR